MYNELAVIKTPARGFSPLAALLGGKTLPSLAARIGIRLGRLRGKPFSFGKTIAAAQHRDVAEMLRRDLDFMIGPVNSERIEAVNGGPFILGMDRSPQLMVEREALYSALRRVDFDELAQAMRHQAQAQLAAGGARFDAISDYARPVAAATAMKLFGIAPADQPLFMEAVRSIFAHTFLNLGGDKKVEARALAAAPLMRQWFEEEIARRKRANETGNDLMGRLLAGGKLGEDGVRRLLGGMLVGSIDTTTTAFAHIFSILDKDDRLAARMLERWRSGGDIYGLCLDALRRWPHNPIVLRRACADTVLGGVKVPAGARVIGWTEAAMRDPDAFPDPAHMLPDRPMNAYLHFGGGLHPCAGRALNAIQIPVLIGLLLEAGAKRSGRLRWAGPFPDRMPVRIEGTSGR